MAGAIHFTLNGRPVALHAPPARCAWCAWSAPRIWAARGGEPPITVVGAVIASAVFDATGSRQLRLPMTPERVPAGLAAVKLHGS